MYWCVLTGTWNLLLITTWILDNNTFSVDRSSIKSAPFLLIRKIVFCDETGSLVFYHG
jgi:hypothetical protein